MDIFHFLSGSTTSPRTAPGCATRSISNQGGCAPVSAWRSQPTVPAIVNETETLPSHPRRSAVISKMTAILRVRRSRAS